MGSREGIRCRDSRGMSPTARHSPKVLETVNRQSHAVWASPGFVALSPSFRNHLSADVPVQPDLDVHEDLALTATDLVDWLVLVPWLISSEAHRV